MKTPREVLLQRHQAANPKLDRIRRNFVVELTPRPTREPNVTIALVLKLWRELFWPCRRTWAGMAAVWLAILVFNLTHAERGQIVTAKSTTPPEEMRLAFQEQRRVLEEIIGSTPPVSAAEPPRRPNIQPRSQRSDDYLYA